MTGRLNSLDQFTEIFPTNVFITLSQRLLFGSHVDEYKSEGIAY